ncbi:MAG TPA: FecR family protein [Terriglobia bacterium]|nr:FecR family protein [Terriglobia bacterium]
MVVDFGAVRVLAQESESEGYSHARVVRLSFVEGTVTVQRPDMTDWATAPANTPIQEGFKLSTAGDSFAEVEFENADSTARLGQQSLLEFSQLALTPDGGKVNHLVLDQGYATFHFVPADNDDYEVKAGDTTVKPQGKAEFRLDLDQEGRMRVEVFKGSVEAAGPGGDTTVAKNGVLEVAPGESYQIAQGITKDDWDQWVEQRDEGQAVAQAPTPGPYTATSGNLYGWSDLSYYGDWGYLPDYGNVWFPPVGAGWSPYSMGRWCWYPGFGYTWISFEPWGWLPFHYGGWFFDAALGWFWTPLSFGVWSPALVTWYQGPGWVGWAPRPTRLPRHVPHSTPSGGTQNCTAGRTCMTAVSLDVLREGKPVTPQSLMAVDLAGARGRVVSGPELTPTRLASLPGTPATEALRHSHGSVHSTGGVAVPESFRVGGQQAFSGKAPSSVGLDGAEKASAGFFGARTGPARENSGPVRSGNTRTERTWGGASSGHFGESRAAPRESSGVSTGSRGGGSSHGGGGGASSSGGGHASSGGGSSGGGGGGGGHSGGGSSSGSGSHH